MKDVRPTSGKVLQALFNILGDINNFKFLDLFAGTGRVGLEALERGAEFIAFVESVRDRADKIKSLKILNNLNSLILSLEVKRAITWLVKREYKFDVIFADPPYNLDWGKNFLAINNLDKLLTPESILVFERSKREDLILNLNYELISTRDYGETVLEFLKLKI
ncbi:MAG: RsmD family RNA methyltransferase [Synergistaceae bacterium]|nr:RsmD family RNA methyltransferase [Synergistaceae bacterium]MBQ4419301.1 RsmD family RNA methyltransferase [Synergistaceae bacterium]MBQ7569534.1 RsmD family RNA methyltransferase [Synergistaceae bacterium]